MCALLRPQYFGYNASVSKGYSGGHNRIIVTFVINGPFTTTHGSESTTSQSYPLQSATGASL